MHLRENRRKHARSHAFTNFCECEPAYLLHAEADGTHGKAACPAEGGAPIHDELSGMQRAIEDNNGPVVCERLARRQLAGSAPISQQGPPVPLA